MAIQPKLCIQIEADASKITITDDTGAYTANNENGYGTPNNDRSDLAGVLIVEYQPYSGQKNVLTDLTDTFIKADDTFTNNEESVFTVDFFKDGWYEISYVLVPTVASGLVTPAEGAFVHRPSGLAKYDSELNLQDATLADLEDLKNPASLQLVNNEYIYTPKLQIKLNTLIREYFACKQCQECDCSDEYDEVLYLREGIQSLSNQFQISQYEAQRMVERLTKQYKIK